MLRSLEDDVQNEQAVDLHITFRAAQHNTGEAASHFGSDYRFMCFAKYHYRIKVESTAHAFGQYSLQYE